MNAANILGSHIFKSCMKKRQLWAVTIRGGKNNRFFNASRFSLEWFHLDAEKCIIGNKFDKFDKKISFYNRIVELLDRNRMVRCQEIPTPSKSKSRLHNKTFRKMVNPLCQLFYFYIGHLTIQQEIARKTNHFDKQLCPTAAFRPSTKISHVYPTV